MAAHPSVLDAARCVRRLGVRRGLTNVARMMPHGGETKVWLNHRSQAVVRRDTSDWETFVEVFLERCYADDFVSLFGKVPGSDDVRTIVDAGANVGLSTLYFRTRYPHASVWSIEPDIDNFELLRRNTDGDPMVHAIWGALWSQHGEVSIVDPSAPANSIRVIDDETSTRRVPAFTIGDLLETIPTHHIDLLKIDIEGAEREVFDHPDPLWLHRVGMIFIELHDWKSTGSSHAFHAALSGFEYDEFVLGGTVGVLIKGSAVER